MRREDDLGEWLERVRPASPASVFTDDIQDTSTALEALLTAERQPARVVTLCWHEVPPLGNELQHLVSALAEATLASYPELYSTTLTSNQRWPEAELETAAHEIRQRVPAVLGVACRQILVACSRGELPTVCKLSNAERVHQLSLAIEPERLAIVISVTDAQPHTAGLRGLAHGAEWLAINSRARVILILPRVLHSASELDHVTYTACLFTPIGIPSNVETPAAAALSANKQRRVALPPAQVSVSPVASKPHPRSEVERLLYERIRSDTQLSQLFSYNQHVLTRYGSNPRVDLLCSRHRLVIELDGEDHRGLLTWTNDRKRDIELTLSDYRVLRFPSSTLVENAELVLCRIREAVTLSEGHLQRDHESL